MSIATDFETFCKNLRMSEKTVSDIQQRFHTITRRINIDFWGSTSDVNHSFYAGSYGRGTEIFLSDIDMVVVLPSKYYDQYGNYLYNGQSALLQAVKKSIQTTYPSTSMSGDGQVVVVSFSDGVKFEIVPAFEYTDGTFAYPDTNNGGSWRTMDPKAEIDAFNELNKKCNKNLKRLCRMARAWNALHNVHMKGFLIDTLAYKFLASYEYKDKSYLYYDWMSRDFMQYLYDNADQSYWLAPGSGWHVTKNCVFKYDALIGVDNCKKAIEYEAKKMPASQHKTWREHYGTKFPIA